MELKDLAKSVAKRAAYDSGALPLYHRRRNRHALTVTMFHRVLSPTDPRWATADPDYTISDRHFDDCLSFFAEHYRIVSLDDVRAARAGRRRLPERPLLITFDDGWSDNEEYALPLLRRRAMPALMFVVSEAVGREPPFWQEQLIGAFLGRRLDRGACGTLWRGAGGAADREPHWTTLGHLRVLISRLEGLTEAARALLLAPLADELAPRGERHMVTAEQVRRLRDGGVAIGSHGRTHTPLDRAADSKGELDGSRAALGAILGDPRAATSLSFPHGRHTAEVVRQAHDKGYELLFTSYPSLNATEDGRCPALLGRRGIDTDAITDERGRFRAEQLALLLFRSPHAAVPATWAPGQPLR